jgi:outer membrane protein insertion porin family
MRRLFATVVTVACLGSAAPARAEDVVPPPFPASAAAVDTGAIAERGEFGPAIVIEDIQVVGNSSTRKDLIIRALPFGVGDALTAGGERLKKAPFKVLSLGFFRNVSMSMQRGSERGKVILIIQVEERGTVVLNRLWFGSSTIAPWWFGADLSERNVLGSGISIGGGFLYASHDDVAGSDDQWAGELRLSLPAVYGPRWAAFATLTGAHGSEAYQVRGDNHDTAASSFRAFGYRRYTGRLGAVHDLTSLSRLSFALRGELLDSELPDAPTRTLNDGPVVPVDLHLDRGESRVVSAAVAYDRDTRSDPVLPHAGSRITLSAELSGSVLGSSYDFVTLLGRYEHWWQLRAPGHAIGLHLSGGAVLGNAPRFDQLQASDVNRMLSPRALGLLVSANAPIDVLGTAPDKPSIGELGASATVEYAYRLFDGRSGRIYGGDLFVGAGLWALSETASPRTRDRSLWRSLPVDVFVDAGLRIDTDIGVFELTVANALGRLPR